MNRNDLRRLFARARDLCGHLDANAAAVAKYARMEPRDREWIRPGLQAGILSPEILEDRFENTSFLDTAETERARQALEEDCRWLEGRTRRGS